MSSSAFSVRLQPDPWLQTIVLVSGKLLAAIGIILIVLLEVPEYLRIAAGLAWLGWSRLELNRVIRSNDSCREIQLHADGSASVRNSDGTWCLATVQSGSFILARFAWIRLRVNDGSDVFECLRGDAAQSHDWRRLQILKRHVGAWR